MDCSPTLWKKTTIHVYGHVGRSTMNNDANKELRKWYIDKNTLFMAINKEIIWMDETNVNYFFRRTHTTSKSSDQAVIRIPICNIHILGAVSPTAVVKWSRHVFFNALESKQWAEIYMKALLQTTLCWSVITDNAPRNTTMDECETMFPGKIVLRSASYSPALNPIRKVCALLSSVTFMLTISLIVRWNKLTLDIVLMLFNMRKDCILGRDRCHMEDDYG